MRRYWLPALLAWELRRPTVLPCGSAPRRGLVAFAIRGPHRLIEEHCPHRRASLFFGRNEECGLRCVYHGWKFRRGRRCIRHDEMNRRACTSRRRSSSRRTPLSRWADHLGLFGPWSTGRPCRPSPGRRRRKPTGTCRSRPGEQLAAGAGGRRRHSQRAIMHRVSRPTRRAGIQAHAPFVRSKAPTLVVDLTDYGYQYASIRPLRRRQRAHRTYQLILPFHQIRPRSRRAAAPRCPGTSGCR